MKRLAVLGGLVLAAVGLPAWALTADATAQRPSPKKIWVCHATSSAAKPYRLIRVSERSAHLVHEKHDRDIIGTETTKPTCPGAALTARRGGRKLSATLAPSTANTTGGSGTFELRTNPGQGLLCYRLTVTGIPAADVTVAHIHYATGPNEGGIAIDLQLPETFASPLAKCVAADRDLVRAVLKSPAAFYVNVHTTAYPAGAIQGRLAR